MRSFGRVLLAVLGFGSPLMAQTIQPPPPPTITPGCDLEPYSLKIDDGGVAVTLSGEPVAVFEQAAKSVTVNGASCSLLSPTDGVIANLQVQVAPLAFDGKQNVLDIQLGLGYPLATTGYPQRPQTPGISVEALLPSFVALDARTVEGPFGGELRWWRSSRFGVAIMGGRMEDGAPTNCLEAQQDEGLVLRNRPLSPRAHAQLFNRKPGETFTPIGPQDRGIPCSFAVRPLSSSLLGRLQAVPSVVPVGVPVPLRVVTLSGESFASPGDGGVRLTGQVKERGVLKASIQVNEPRERVRLQVLDAAGVAVDSVDISVVELAGRSKIAALPHARDRGLTLKAAAETVKIAKELGLEGDVHFSRSTSVLLLTTPNGLFALDSSANAGNLFFVGAVHRPLGDGEPPGEALERVASLLRSRAKGSWTNSFALTLAREDAVLRPVGTTEAWIYRATPGESDAGAVEWEERHLFGVPADGPSWLYPLVRLVLDTTEQSELYVVPEFRQAQPDEAGARAVATALVLPLSDEEGTLQRLSSAGLVEAGSIEGAGSPPDPRLLWQVAEEPAPRLWKWRKVARAAGRFGVLQSGNESVASQWIVTEIGEWQSGADLERLWDRRQEVSRIELTGDPRVVAGEDLPDWVARWHSTLGPGRFGLEELGSALGVFLVRGADSSETDVYVARESPADDEDWFRAIGRSAVSDGEVSPALHERLIADLADDWKREENRHEPASAEPRFLLKTHVSGEDPVILVKRPAPDTPSCLSFSSEADGGAEIRRLQVMRLPPEVELSADSLRRILESAAPSRPLRFVEVEPGATWLPILAGLEVWAVRTADGTVERWGSLGGLQRKDRVLVAQALGLRREDFDHAPYLQQHRQLGRGVMVATDAGDLLVADRLPKAGVLLTGARQRPAADVDAVLEGLVTGALTGPINLLGRLAMAGGDAEVLVDQGGGQRRIRVRTASGWPSVAAPGEQGEPELVLELLRRAFTRFSPDSTPLLDLSSWESTASTSALLGTFPGAVAVLAAKEPTGALRSAVLEDRTAGGLSKEELATVAPFVAVADPGEVFVGKAGSCDSELFAWTETGTAWRSKRGGDLWGDVDYRTKRGVSELLEQLVCRLPIEERFETLDLGDASLVVRIGTPGVYDELIWPTRAGAAAEARGLWTLAAAAPELAEDVATKVATSADPLAAFATETGEGFWTGVGVKAQSGTAGYHSREGETFPGTVLAVPMASDWSSLVDRALALADRDSNQNLQPVPSEPPALLIERPHGLLLLGSAGDDLEIETTAQLPFEEALLSRILRLRAIEKQSSSLLLLDETDSPRYGVIGAQAAVWDLSRQPPQRLGGWPIPRSALAEAVARGLRGRSVRVAWSGESATWRAALVAIDGAGEQLYLEDGEEVQTDSPKAPSSWLVSDEQLVRGFVDRVALFGFADLEGVEHSGRFFLLYRGDGSQCGVETFDSEQRAYKPLCDDSAETNELTAFTVHRGAGWHQPLYLQVPDRILFYGKSWVVTSMSDRFQISYESCGSADLEQPDLERILGWNRWRPGQCQGRAILQCHQDLPLEPCLSPLFERIESDGRICARSTIEALGERVCGGDTVCMTSCFRGLASVTPFESPKRGDIGVTHSSTPLSSFPAAVTNSIAAFTSF